MNKPLVTYGWQNKEGAITQIVKTGIKENFYSEDGWKSRYNHEIMEMYKLIVIMMIAENPIRGY